MIDHRIEMVPVAMLRPYPRNARKHSAEQIKQIASSITQFDFMGVVIVDEDMTILAGHGRVEAAKYLKHDKVPVLRVSHLSENQKRAFVLADNKLPTNGQWDREILAQELTFLAEEDFPITVIGFTERELENFSSRQIVEAKSSTQKEDRLPALGKEIVTRPGDVWQLGPHTLYCVNPSDGGAVDEIMGADLAAVVFSSIAHRSTPAASGCAVQPVAAEKQLVKFLLHTLGNAQGYCRSGALFFLSATWPQIGAVLEASKQLSLELVDLCVWVDSASESPSVRHESSGLYRESHELVFVLRNGPHSTSSTARSSNRTNVWTYPSPSRKKGHKSLEKLLGKQQPVEMIAAAITDSSQPGEILIGCFDSLGTTVIAAEKSGRIARIIEMDPQQCDLIVRRFMAFTSSGAKLASTGDNFESVALQRAAQNRAGAAHDNEL